MVELWCHAYLQFCTVFFAFFFFVQRLHFLEKNKNKKVHQYARRFYKYRCITDLLSQLHVAILFSDSAHDQLVSSGMSAGAGFCRLGLWAAGGGARLQLSAQPCQVPAPALEDPGEDHVRAGHPGGGGAARLSRPPANARSQGLLHKLNVMRGQWPDHVTTLLVKCWWKFVVRWTNEWQSVDAFLVIIVSAIRKAWLSIWK